MDTRSQILQALYKLFPFNLKGDAKLTQTKASVAVSCIINFYGRTDLLRNILTCLSGQVTPKDKFEVVLAEDRGGTEEGKQIVREFGKKLNIRYFTLEENFGVMGYARNFALSKSRGEYVLFLDDDTMIPDSDFLDVLVREFEETGADAIMPYGSASFSVIKDKYNYHDPYFPTNRCMAYRHEALRELGGFVSEIIGQEDVELTLRLIASQKIIHRSNVLSYMHPPLIYKNIDKAAAVGYSFARLRSRYPLIIWLALLLNGMRYLPLYLFPIGTKYRMQAKFSLGFTLGIWYSITGRKIEYS